MTDPTPAVRQLHDELVALQRRYAAVIASDVSVPVRRDLINALDLLNLAMFGTVHAMAGGFDK